MRNVALPAVSDHAFTLNTGSPHYVSFVDDAASVDVNAEGRKIRNSAPYLRDGINVNFVEVHPDAITVRTFERGVEEETLSCGTGVTASAIVAVFSGKLATAPVKVFTRGGELSVDFNSNDALFENVFLTGPADKVFSGSMEV
jgi:diaminopimelate epimerase